MVKAADLTTSWTEVNLDGGGIQYRLSVTDTAGGVLLEQRYYHLGNAPQEKKLLEKAALCEVANRAADTREYRVPADVMVTGKDLRDLLANAMDAGLTWCQEIIVTTEATDGRAEFTSDVPALGGSLTFVTDEGERYLLDRKSLLKGLALAAKAGHVKLGGGDDWLSDVDAPIAWAVLEFALFGEVRYC